MQGFMLIGAYSQLLAVFHRWPYIVIELTSQLLSITVAKTSFWLCVYHCIFLFFYQLF